MKKYSKILVAILSFTLILASCSKKDKKVKPASPSFESIEVGHDSSHTGYAGHDIHTEVEILAPGKIKSVQVVIHRGDGEDGWEFDRFYDDYNGQRNATFHKHINIPADAVPGEYYFHLYVTDENGQSAKKGVKLQIKGMFELTDLSYGSKDMRDDKIANVGWEGIVDSRLYISANIKSIIELSSIKIDLIQEDIVSKEEYDFAEIETIDDYDPETEEFKTSVFIPREMSDYTGPYKLRITLINKDGNKSIIENEVEVTTQPFIEDFELGSGHGKGERTNHIGYIGKDIHQEGKIYAIFNRLESIYVEIVQDVKENPRIITTSYDEESDYYGAVIGVRNDYFHQHIDIPSDMPEGDYIYSILVTDRDGLTYQRTLTLELKKP